MGNQETREKYGWYKMFYEIFIFVYIYYVYIMYDTFLIMDGDHNYGMDFQEITLFLRNYMGV